MITIAKCNLKKTAIKQGKGDSSAENGKCNGYWYEGEELYRQCKACKKYVYYSYNPATFILQKEKTMTRNQICEKCKLIFGEGNCDGCGNNYKIALSEELGDLANAIIIQAVEDYKKCLNSVPMFLKREIAAEEIERRITNEKRQLAKFFKSEHFKTLTDIDGVGLLKKLKDEHLRKVVKRDYKRTFKLWVGVKYKNKFTFRKTRITAK